MEKLGKELARAYMAAYDEALNKTFREDYAGQVATIVTMCIANRPNRQRSAGDMTNRIFEAILADPLKKQPKSKPQAQKMPKKEDED